MNLFNGGISVTGVPFFMFCIVAVIAVGYSIGRITVKGMSLGNAGVFIVALIFGCFLYGQLDTQLTVTTAGETVSYTVQALKIVENAGLILFVTSIGFIAGPTFFSNIKHHFKSYVLLGLIVVLAGGLTASACLWFGRTVGGETDQDTFTAMMAGVFSGAITSTPAFSAAKSTVAAQYESIVSVGYGIAYMFGVVGKVLFVQLIPKLKKADMAEERAKLAQVMETKNPRGADAKTFSMDTYGLMMFALAATLGLVVGAIKIGPLFSLTSTGGCLLVALLLGHFGRCGRLCLLPPENTLRVFRELGLVLFLVGAGISGGAQFVENFKWSYFIYGMIITIVPMTVGYLFAKHVFKLQLLNTLGSITGGMTSTPALSTLIHVAGTEDVAAAYAATYPVALVAVVLVSQLLVIVF